MPATIIDGYSIELAQVQPPSYAPLKTNQYEGRVRIAVFSKVFASEGAGLDLALTKIPKGARLIDGVWQFSATLGGTTTVSFGLAATDGSGFIDAAGVTSDGVALLMAALASTATTKQFFVATAALNYMYETEKELYLTLTTAAGAMGTQTLKGHLLYVVD